MATKTPKIGLNKPGTGEYGWDALINQNIDTLDALVGQLLDERAISGTATGGSATTLTDTSLNIGVDAFAGAVIIIRRGGAVLRAEKIISNTADTFTFASGAAVQAGDQYTVLSQANCIPNAEKGAPNGVATLDAAGQVVERLSYEGVANGVATLDANGELAQPVRIAQMPDAGQPNGLATLDAAGKVVERLAYEGIAGGVATLDANGLLTAAQLGGASLATSGYQKLPSGLIIQWGAIPTGSTASAQIDVAFPITFPTACLAVAANLKAGWDNYTRVVQITYIATAGFGVKKLGIRDDGLGSAGITAGGLYIAIGH